MPALTEEQLIARRSGMGSSDIAAILGLSSFQNHSPWDVFLEKTGAVEPSPMTPEQKRGHDLEPLLLQWYCEETGATFLPGGMIYRPGEPWAFATIDGKVIGRPALVEAKAVGIGPSMDWDKYADDGVPQYVRVQTTWQMWCSDYAEEVHVSTMIGGPSGYRIFSVPRDRELEDLIVKRARAFWFDHVLMGKPPEIDASDACRRYLNSKYPEPTSPLLRDATEEEHALALERHACFMAAKQAEERKKVLDSMLLSRIEADTGILGPDGWKCTHKVDKNGAPRFYFGASKAWPGARGAEG